MLLVHSICSLSLILYGRHSRFYLSRVYLKILHKVFNGRCLISPISQISLFVQIIETPVNLNTLISLLIEDAIL